MSENRKTLVGAGLFLLGFALFAYFLPTIMVGLGSRSMTAAVVVAALFVVAPFLVLWLRGRSQAKKRLD